MKILITGDRNWNDDEVIEEVLKKLPSGSIVIHGDCKGADKISGHIAKKYNHVVRKYPADWDGLGKKAGVLRNQQMLDEEHVEGEKFDACFAFHDNLSKSRGTLDMINRAERERIKVLRFTTTSFPNLVRKSKENMILGFFNENRFLSNFYDSILDFEGKRYKTVEHAYQANKSLDNDIREMIRNCASPYDAKKMGKSIACRPDWDEYKLVLMTQLIHEKFKNPFLRQLLLDTKEKNLIESNTWYDIFWGTCNGIGENNLGKILMKERESIVKENEEYWRV